MDQSLYAVYIMTNINNTVLYTGSTSELKNRIWQHKQKLVEGFTKRYNITKLVYYEVGEDRDSVLSREKQIKAGSRADKIHLINNKNPNWDDLFDKID